MFDTDLQMIDPLPEDWLRERCTQFSRLENPYRSLLQHMVRC